MTQKPHNIPVHTVHQTLHATIMAFESEWKTQCMDNTFSLSPMTHQANFYIKNIPTTGHTDGALLVNVLP